MEQPTTTRVRKNKGQTNTSSKEKFERYMHAFASIISVEEIGCGIDKDKNKCILKEEEGWVPSDYLELHKNLLTSYCFYPDLEEFRKRQLEVTKSLLAFAHRFYLGFETFTSRNTTEIIRIKQHLQYPGTFILYPWGPSDHQVYLDIWHKVGGTHQVTIFDLGAGRNGEQNRINYMPIIFEFKSFSDFSQWFSEKIIPTQGQVILNKENYRLQFDMQYFKNITLDLYDDQEIINDIKKGEKYKTHFNNAWTGEIKKGYSAGEMNVFQHNFDVKYFSTLTLDLIKDSAIIKKIKKTSAYREAFKKDYDDAYWEAAKDFYSKIYERRVLCNWCAPEVQQTTGNCVVKNLLAAIRQDALWIYGEKKGAEIFKKFYLNLLKVALKKAGENINNDEYSLANLPSFDEICKYIQNSQATFLGINCQEIIRTIEFAYQQLNEKLGFNEKEKEIETTSPSSEEGEEIESDFSTLSSANQVISSNTSLGSSPHSFFSDERQSSRNNFSYRNNQIYSRPWSVAYPPSVIQNYNNNTEGHREQENSSRGRPRSSTHALNSRWK